MVDGQIRLERNSFRIQRAIAFLEIRELHQRACKLQQEGAAVSQLAQHASAQSAAGRFPERIALAQKRIKLVFFTFLRPPAVINSV